MKSASESKMLPPVDIDVRLSQPFSVQPVWHPIAPSRSVEEQAFDSATHGGRIRGLMIHRMLQLATQEQTALSVLQQLAGEFCLAADDPGLLHCWREVETLMGNGKLAWLFKPASSIKAWNEVPLQYQRRQQTVYGVIDRLLISNGVVHLVDYKTHRTGDASQQQQLIEHYRPQLDLYREGVRKLWPGHTVKTYLLLTDGGVLLTVE